MADALEDLYEAPEENRQYTYADYLTWKGPERYQLLYGEAFMMAAPSVAHQAILVEMVIQFGNWLRGKPCRVFAAPLDVRLFPEDDNSDDTVVQPDLLVVCDRTKFAKGSVNGSPDLAVEIVSPSTSKKEHFLKYGAYLEAGVQEYWVIYPEQKIVQVHVNKNDHFICVDYKGDAAIQSVVLQGFSIELKTLWAAADDVAPVV
jgi:Uma2 family endonuclease